MFHGKTDERNLLCSTPGEWVGGAGYICVCFVCVRVRVCVCACVLICVCVCVCTSKFMFDVIYVHIILYACVSELACDFTHLASIADILVFYISYVTCVLICAGSYSCTCIVI